MELKLISVANIRTQEAVASQAVFELDSKNYEDVIELILGGEIVVSSTVKNLGETSQIRLELTMDDYDFYNLDQTPNETTISISFPETSDLFLQVIDKSYEVGDDRRVLVRHRLHWTTDDNGMDWLENVDSDGNRTVR